MVKRNPLIVVKKEIKEKLDRCKLVPEESYNSVIERLLDTKSG